MGKTCFVIGPIGKDGGPERKHADLLLNAVIKHVLEAEDVGYKVKRADEDADPGMISDRMISDIINADLVVADLTDLNPNAFYELGIRHSTEKPVIHIAKLGTQLPFDNVNHRTIFVDLTDWQSIEQARSRLASSAHTIQDPAYRVSNPITQANASFKMRESSDPRDRIIMDINERLSRIELQYNSNYVHGQDARDIETYFRKCMTLIMNEINTGIEVGILEKELNQRVVIDLGGQYQWRLEKKDSKRIKATLLDGLTPILWFDPPVIVK